MSGGWGTSWGGLPWGGALFNFGVIPPVPPMPPSGFDVFCFFEDVSSMGTILTDPNVSLVDAGGQFSIVSTDVLDVSSYIRCSILLDVAGGG